ncbi:MAG TPA: hypothetical protein VLX30_15265 [Burkholderiales bacterium]|nr:hypothetical protein [Burkholderiales bacterium]
MSARGVAVAIVAALGLVALGGCGEKPQASSYQHGKYQGKPDTLPWDNAPLAYGGAKWDKGSKTSWEDEIKTRSQSQNEYVRIGQ